MFNFVAKVGEGGDIVAVDSLFTRECAHGCGDLGIGNVHVFDAVHCFFVVVDLHKP